MFPSPAAPRPWFRRLCEPLGVLAGLAFGAALAVGAVAVAQAAPAATPDATHGTAAGAIPAPVDPEAQALADASELLARADRAGALPAGQRCVVDLSVHDLSVHDDGGVTGWRVALSGADALVVSTTLAEGRRQAVLQRGTETWFQTEAMRGPMRVGAAQRLTGQLNVGDLLAPRLAATWEPVALARTATGATVTATARPGAGAAWAGAELDLDTKGVLRSARFYAPSGRLMRTATWRWEGATLRGLDVVDPLRAEARTRVDLSAPRCAAVAWSVAPETLLARAIGLVGER